MLWREDLFTVNVIGGKQNHFLNTHGEQIHGSASFICA